ncbi:MAG: hypothetical protein VX822_00405 [Candidatus Neomarinimicrobiota bacterium]|nr:hypothetical protein [Candidatus Neomarinimicrobiota bacterium]
MRLIRTFLHRLLPLDWILLAYNLSILVLIIMSPHSSENKSSLITIHLFMLLWLFFLVLTSAHQETRLNRWMRLWYPLLMLLWFTFETGLLQHTLFPRDFDPELLVLETGLFPERYYFTTPLSLSLFSHELLHGIVLSFFILLWLPAWIARRRAFPLVKEYIFVLSFVVLVHFWIGILLPISGPASLRSQVIPNGTVFIPATEFLTQAAFRGSSAVTSLFATAGVTIAYYSGKLFPRARRLFVVWLFLLLISTVVCTFHYSVSTIAGVLSGTLLLVIGRKLYEKSV